MILDFQMNNLAAVEMVERGLWRVSARTEDNLFAAEVSLDVKVPALDIRRAELEVKRDEFGITPDLSSAADKLVGVRVGPGMTKIIRGIVGAEGGSFRMAELVLEAMEMVINAITVPELRKAVQLAGESVSFAHDGPKVVLNDVVISGEQAKLMAGNPRLKDSCVAFRDLD